MNWLKDNSTWFTPLISSIMACLALVAIIAPILINFFTKRKRIEIKRKSYFTKQIIDVSKTINGIIWDRTKWSKEEEFNLSLKFMELDSEIELKLLTCEAIKKISWHADNRGITVKKVKLYGLDRKNSTKLAHLITKLHNSTQGLIANNGKSFNKSDFNNQMDVLSNFARSSAKYMRNEVKISKSK